MDGFSSKELDESNFGESKGFKVVKAFDAFPKTKASYQERTHAGGVWTVVLVLASIWLINSELVRWWAGETTHSFSVEQGVGHDLQMNLDVVVAMSCEDLHVNVQDASGDRILAGQALTKDNTRWDHWIGKKSTHALGVSRDERAENSRDKGFLAAGKVQSEYKVEDVHDYLGTASGRGRKYKKTPKIPRGVNPNACRIYGSMHGNKVQGDFHITARGHGYMEMGRQHLDHGSFNFSHQINELSFGPFYPSLTNPLDNTYATTPNHFHKFQYYLSVVPTIYTTDPKSLRAIDKFGESPSSGSDGLEAQARKYQNSRKHVFTNQYAVTEQSHQVPENAVPGVFVKFDIEPVLLTIAEEWRSLPSLFIRLVNVVSGLLVAGGWCYKLSEWANEVWGRRRRRTPTGFIGEQNGDLDKKG
ncbi:DUF1692-domain-containing protein [Polychaeton citri CBS 116435]|uniref:Endoplasmic reticulum-Golgi intermediate compartment protein n=1 Tax=Polychaeton citri CBS 116435 TaxID=1314669 RepID=A0A9P4Q047_9PEZI|nr:DUF1692-domain-containing protein [Polychaeton citri CBS 116435]